MSAIIGILMAVRSLTIMAGFATGDSSKVTFNQPQISVSKSSVTVNASLKNAVTDDMRKMALAGTAIPLFVVVTLNSGSTKIPLAESKSMNILLFDPLKGEFHVQRESAAEKSYKSIDEAFSDFVSFNNMHVCSLSVFSKEQSYVFKLQALLGTAKVDALGGNTFDFMYYWDYKRPSIRTEPISGQLILYGGRK
ncbi:MAG: DUF4390 domain-containing protein [Fibrobacteres bacterium]|nr:DUF4390 domain-containing protein [Fibrobacterota bacterium]